jgi:AraC-like DNA-binding protein
MPFETSIHHHVRAEVIEPTIAQRVLRVGRAPHRWFHHLVFIAAGKAEHRYAETSRQIQGPALMLAPPSEGEAIAFAAGSHGFLLGVSPDIIAEAFGDHAESPALRLFAGGRAVTEHLAAGPRAEFTLLFQGAIAETHEAGRGSRMAAAAYVRLIYMLAWRLAAPAQQPEPHRGGSGPILQRFRQLVETHFRQHWAVSRYARELGVSADRLHAICSRSLGRSPIELIHDRLTQEARLRLERSGHSVQDISDTLGFRDPANFSHFFKRRTGLSPAKYRAHAASTASGGAVPVSSDYADWP